jgi:drug/metabolite transporter (DMT)-like permease
LVGFAGIAVISLPRGGIDGVQAWGVLVILAATLFWALGSYLSPRVGLPAGAMVATAYEMLAGGTIMTAVGFAVGEPSSFSAADVPAEGWVAMAYLVVVGSILGYTAYVFALGNAPLSVVGTYAYVNPVVAVILGA